MKRTIFINVFNNLINIDDNCLIFVYLPSTVFKAAVLKKNIKINGKYWSCSVEKSIITDPLIQLTNRW